MKTYKEIIDKLKDIISKELSNRNVLDQDVADALGLDRTILRKQKSRNSIHYPEIMQFLAKRNISINWFFFGQLPESLVDSTSNYIILNYQKTITATAGAGGINDVIDPTPLIIDKQLLNHINSSYKYTEILKVTGDSMEPDIQENSLIFIDKSKIDINTPGVYVVNTLDGVLIKKIKICDNNCDILMLESINKEYKTIQIHINDVEIVGKVCGVLGKLNT
jgi:repressor LexA